MSLRVASIAGLTGLVLCAAALAREARCPTHIPQPDFWVGSAPGGVPVHFVDSAVFPVGADSMRVEAYYRIAYDRIGFQELASGHRARLRFDLSAIKDGESRPSGRISSDRTLDISDDILDRATDYYLLHQVSLVLPAVPHLIESTVGLVSDPKATESAQAYWWSCLPPSEAQGVAFGEIQVTGQIAPPSGSSHFQKGGVDFYPNPTRRFSNDMSTLVFFSENINHGNAAKSVHLRYGIQDLYGEDFWGGESKRVDGGVATLNPGANHVLSGFDISSLETGFYRLVLEYLEPSGKIVARRGRIFTYQAPTGRLDPPDPYVSTLDERSLGGFADRVLRYVADPTDVNRYERLDQAPARRRFIEDWWKREAAEAGLPVSAHRVAVLRRYEIADQRYSEPHRAGWRTDRGRIMIIHGEPLESVTNDFGTDARAGEMWEMQIRGERKFCYFLDRQGTGQFVLDATDIEGEAAARRTRPVFQVGTEAGF